MGGAVADKRDAALGQALKALLCGKKQGGPRSAGKAKQVTVGQLVHLLHRLLIVSTAIWYMTSSIESTVASLRLLNGARNQPMTFEPYTNNYILDWVGKSTIRKSPFVTDFLKNDLTPRTFTAYLEANRTISTERCKAPLFDAKLYSNFFLRAALGAVQRDAPYNLTEFGTYEIVVPVVDCSSTALVRGSNTIAQLFYVMRHKLDSDDVLMLTVRFSMQDYRVFETKEVGPVGLGQQQWVRDMSAPTVHKTSFTGILGYPFQVAPTYVYTTPEVRDDGWWVATVIPPSSSIAPRRVITSRRTGFFIAADTEQANILMQHWPTETDPAAALSKWRWQGEPLVQDSWAWVHFVHVYFAITSLVNLGLLFLVVYRNILRGRVWFGDAFVSVSNTLFARGPVILITWLFNGFWALMELCLHDAHAVAGTQQIFIQDDIMRADLLTLFLALTAAVAHVMRDRIDPAFAIIVFELIFANRVGILKGFPGVVETLSNFATADIERSVLSASETLEDTSPLRLWTTRRLAARDGSFIAACMVPYFWAIFCMVLFVCARKLYRHFYHEKIYVQRSKTTSGTKGTVASHGEGDSMVLYKRNLTIFEVATGVELLTSYGVLSDYENFLFIKGLKYASADGIYSSGFVIANDKFLIATSDWLVIVIQKLTKIRLRNVYTYVVDGNTVQQRAQLVYANTFTWSDLVHLNVTVLS